MKFAPHIRHVRDQQREDAAAEYTRYQLGLLRIQADIGVTVPPMSRDDFEDMRDRLASRHGVTA